MKSRTAIYWSMFLMAMAVGSCSDTVDGVDSKPEGAVCTGNECAEGMLCVDNFCRKICQVNADCAKHQICDTSKLICLDSAGYQCSANEDCKTPGQCEVMRDAVCEGGRCIYQAQEAGVSCDDERICTINDKCDGNKNCIGTTFECVTKPADECIGNNNIFRTYEALGHCEVSDGAPSCVYAYEDKACDNCEVNCNHYCDNIDCSPYNQEGLCVEHVCDYRADSDNPCVLRNKVDGTACKYQDALSEKIVSGYCAKGECVECIENSQCANNSLYPECLKVACIDNKCSSAPQSGEPCGIAGNCYLAVLYKEAGSCATDGLSCVANKIECAPYQCNSSADSCLQMCNADKDCIAGYFCTNDHNCQEKSANGQVCNYEYQGRDCQSGHCDQLNNDDTIAVCCADGNCCQEADENCGSQQKCQKSTHQCISGDKDSPCLVHEDCKEGLYCNELTLVCTSKIVSGASICKSDAECVSGHCDLSTSGPETGRCCEAGECCDTKDDCPANNVCKNNSCTEDDSGTPCTSDNDCNRLASYCAPDKDDNMVCTAKKNNGKSCQADKECASDHCVEGLCCDTACEDSAMSCSNDSYGKTKGQCRKVLGETCTSGSECQSDFCVDGYCCNTKCSADATCKNDASGFGELSYFVCNAPNNEGTCTAKSKSCGLYKCTSDGSACQSSCDGSAGQCVSGSYCDGNGKCQNKLLQGELCGKVKGSNAGLSCESGICTDGYCCNTSCDGLCQSCAVSGKEGQCSSVVGGTDDTCNGTCGMSSTGLICKAKIGAKCYYDSDCESDHCADGYCCNTACDGACVSCDQTGKIGTCTFTAGVADPLCEEYCGSDTSTCICKESSSYSRQPCGLRTGLYCYSDYQCASDYCRTYDNICR